MKRDLSPPLTNSQVRTLADFSLSFAARLCYFAIFLKSNREFYRCWNWWQCQLNFFALYFELHLARWVWRKGESNNSGVYTLYFEVVLYLSLPSWKDRLTCILTIVFGSCGHICETWHTLLPHPCQPSQFDWDSPTRSQLVLCNQYRIFLVHAWCICFQKYFIMPAVMCDC